MIGVNVKFNKSCVDRGLRKLEGRRQGGLRLGHKEFDKRM